jgi:type I restriction enzyme S subunit
VSSALVQLADVTERISVGHVGKTIEYYTDHGIPFLRTQNVGEGKLLKDDMKFIVPEFHEKLKKSQLKAGDVLISRVISNRINAGVVPEELDGANCANIILIRPNSKLDSNYLLRYLTSDVAQRALLKRQVGSAQSVVNTSVIKSWEIPLPDLDEQKRIAAILDKADAIHSKRRQAIDLTDQLLRSIFMDMFGDPVTNPKGWDVKPLPELLFFQEGPGVRKWQFRESGVKLLNVRNIVARKLKLDNTERYISEEEANGKYSHFLADAGDLVMASSGVTWGKTAWVEEQHLPLCMNTSTIRFKPLDAKLVTKSYMEGFLNSDSFMRQIERIITGSAQPNFGPSHLKQVEMILPPIKVQKEFHKVQERLVTQKQKEERLLVDSEKLFTSLMHHAFRGELNKSSKAA